MQYCYIHDAQGGNAVKSRCERNEIYYNCFEAGFYRELEMIGRDSGAGAAAHELGRRRQHLHQDERPPGRAHRLTTAGLGSRGRYRFVNNTFILGPEAKIAIQTYGFVESVEMSNNVFYRDGGAAIDPHSRGKCAVDERQARRRRAEQLDDRKPVTIPAEWTGTIGGLDPGLSRRIKGDYALAKGSPCIDAGTMKPKGGEGFEFPNPLFPPAFEPPLSEIWAIDVVKPRAVEGTIDIGAYEFGGGKQTLAESSDTH